MFLTLIACAISSVAAPRPNVILILTDDQGYGDVGFHENPKIHTPNMDRLAREGVRCERFHVNPVCSPTRAGLMTGRYYYRTGVVDTYLGRSMMFPDEVTIAQMLGQAGYHTGIFGKWHLGDNYPMRAMDKGFEESLVLNGGGLAQPGDPPFPVHPDGAYFDPWLRHNGQWVRKKGYVTDVLTDAAIDFIDRHARQPFFLYLPYNAPHTPLLVPEKYYARYKNADLTMSQTLGHPVDWLGRQPGRAEPYKRWQKSDQESVARLYGMVECIDDNLGRLLDRLNALKIADNTVVIFLSDNGPQQLRYNVGLLDLKGNTHEGGVRVPFVIRWPGHFQPGLVIDRLAANIDVAPTLLELCGVPKPAGVRFDGLSLVPLLQGKSAGWPDRTLFFQWHRDDVPELNRACTALSQRYKLVQPLGALDKTYSVTPAFELYDYQADPMEMHNIAAENPDVVARMRRQYEAWFADVTSGRNYSTPPPIYLGAPQQAEVLLTHQDWRGPEKSWTGKGIGQWYVDVRRDGDYAITAHFAKTKFPATVAFTLKGGASSAVSQTGVAAGTGTASIPRMHLPKGLATIQTVLETSVGREGVSCVEVKFVE